MVYNVLNKITSFSVIFLSFVFSKLVTILHTLISYLFKLNKLYGSILIKVLVLRNLNALTIIWVLSYERFFCLYETLLQFV